MPPPIDLVIDPKRLAFMEPLAWLHATNPFGPAWEALLKAALHSNYVPSDGVGCSPEGVPSRNLERVSEGIARAVVCVAEDLRKGAVATAAQRAVYQGVALYAVWDEFGPQLQRLIDEDGVDVPFYDAFVERHAHLFGHPGLSVPEPGHLLALLYKARRGWYFTWKKIRGGSPSAAAARVAIWQANQGSDACTHAHSLYRRLDEIPVLITGETGTGKELAAECVGWSRYLPFDPVQRRFAQRYAADFHPRNLCEVPRDLIESALFGHKRGAFTGAATDATGCFALPRAYGSLFLDEIGELPEHVQVKLLRPLQSRTYVPVGETRPRPILGRHLFATHRDLEALCREGKFRPDLLERMNGVTIHMPSLRQMIEEAPEELCGYVRWFVADKIEDPAQVEAWTERVVGTIHATRSGYAWPRNLRELKNYVERCLLTGAGAGAAMPAVRAPAPVAVTVQSEPPNSLVPSSELLGPRAKKGSVTVEELTQAYVKRVHRLTRQNRSETARRTGLTWRRVGQVLERVRPRGGRRVGEEGGRGGGVSGGASRRREVAARTALWEGAHRRVRSVTDRRQGCERPLLALVHPLAIRDRGSNSGCPGGAPSGRRAGWRRRIAARQGDPGRVAPPRW